jgi:hypothetical protein
MDIDRFDEHTPIWPCRRHDGWRPDACCRGQFKRCINVDSRDLRWLDAAATHSDPNRYADRNANSDTDGDADLYTYGNANGHTDGHSDSDCYYDSDPYSYRDRHGHAYRNAYDRPPDQQARLRERRLADF